MVNNIEMIVKEMKVDYSTYTYIRFIIQNANDGILEYVKKSLEFSASEHLKEIAEEVLEKICHDNNGSLLKILLSGMDYNISSIEVFDDEDSNIVIDMGYLAIPLYENVVDDIYKRLDYANNTFMHREIIDENVLDESEKQFIESMSLYSKAVLDERVGMYSENKIEKMGDDKVRKVEINLNEMVLPDTRYYLLDMVITGLDENVIIEIKHKLLSQTSGSYKSIVKFTMCHLGDDDESIIKLLCLLDKLNAAKYMIEICDDTNVHIFIESIYAESTVSNTIKLKNKLMDYNEVVFEESVLQLSYEEKQAFDDRFQTRYENINEVREGMESVRRGINKSIIRNSMNNREYVETKESEINVNGGIDNMFEIISDAAKQVINMSISNLGMEIECELDNLVAENNDIRDIVQNGNDTRKIETSTKVTIEKLIIKVKTTINK